MLKSNNAKIDAEVWKDVPSKPEIRVSNLGRVWLKPRQYRGAKGGVILTRPKPRLGCKTRASKSALHWYYGLVTTAYGNLKVHRLVCEAFHGPAPSENSVVIHINEDSLDNRAENLRWGTQKENLNMPRFIEYWRSRVGDKSPRTKHQKKMAIMRRRNET